MQNTRQGAVKARTNAGLTIAQCAVKAGVSLGAVRRVERGQNVHSETLRKYADACGVPVSDVSEVTRTA